MKDAESQVVANSKLEVVSAMARVERRVDELRDLHQALWAIACERLELRDEDLSARVAEIEAERAKSKVVALCPDCGSAISIAFRKCQFCGFEDERETAQAAESPFDAV